MYSIIVYVIYIYIYTYTSMQPGWWFHSLLVVPRDGDPDHQRKRQMVAFVRGPERASWLAKETPSG